MAGARQLFIQGGGMGTHDHWDNKLVESLSRELGDGTEVRYPRMPDEGDPRSARWSRTIRREVADLDDGAVVVGHSVGATILVNALAEEPPERELEAIVLIGAPFVGDGGWASSRCRRTWARDCRSACTDTSSTAWRTKRPRRGLPTCTPEPSRRRRCIDFPRVITS